MINLPLLTYAPWSPSKAGTAAKCGLAFKYQYVDKIQSDKKSSAGRVGTTVHRAQELILLDTSVQKSLDQAIEEAKDLTTSEEEKVLAFAEAMQNFYNRISRFKETYEVEESLLEKKWGITSDFQPCDFFSPDVMIRGVVDMGLRLKNGTLIIIDHKSGRVKPIYEFSAQLNTYTVMGLSHFPNVVQVQCAIHFLAAERIKWDTPKTSTYIKETLQPWMINYLNEHAAAVEGFLPRKQTLCNWCEYKTICPEWNVNDEAEVENKAAGSSEQPLETKST